MFDKTIMLWTKKKLTRKEDRMHVDGDDEI